MIRDLLRRLVRVVFPDTGYAEIDGIRAACPHTAPRWRDEYEGDPIPYWYCSDCGYGPMDDRGPGGEA